MDKKSKGLALFIILIIAVSSLSLIVIKPASAQSISKPSVSDFTIQIIQSNYSNYFVITINNQPFTSYEEGANLYYNLRFKPDSWVEWIYYPLAPESGYINASQSDYTSVSIPPTILTPNYPAGTAIDFQLQVLVGHDIAQYSQNIWTGNQFTGETSDWSDTKTITISETSSLSLLIAIVAVFLVIIVVLSLLLFRRHRKIMNQQVKKV
jgi:hypothetical protein